MINFDHRVTLKKGRKCVVSFFGDVHHNLEASHKRLFADYVGYLADRAKTDEVRASGQGDYCDPFSSGEKLKVRDLHGGTIDQIDKLTMELIDDFHAVVKPVAGSILGLLEGHHFHRFQSHGTKMKNGTPLFGATTTEYLCNLIGCAYLGTMTLSTYWINNKPLKFLSHHGYGSARTRSGRLVKRRRLAEKWEADIYVLGHDHDLFIEEESRMSQEKGDVGNLYRYYVASGSYLRGYITGTPFGTYVEEALLPPAELGSPIFEVEDRDGRLHIKHWLFK